MKLINISKTYHNKNGNTKALDSINLSFSGIGMNFILGESGCGKTTLLNIMSGIDTDYTGIIDQHGHVEYIHQNHQLFENFSVMDNLLISCNDQEKIKQILDKFNILDANQKVKKLSGGEKKRVQIIRSFLSDCDYLIADEPTASLDHENAILVMDTLKEISKNTCVIIVTHDFSLANLYKDRIIKMGKGVILSDETYDVQSSANKISNQRRSIRSHIVLILKEFKSRWIEMLCRLFLVFFGIIVIFVSTHLFTSLNDTINENAKWMNNENVLVSVPNEGNNVSRDPQKREIFGEIKSDKAFYYDLYSMNDIYKVKSKIPGAIGYSIGWDYYQCEITSDSSFVPMLNLYEYANMILSYQKQYMDTKELPYPQYEDDLKRLEYNQDDIPNTKPDDIYHDFFDFHHYAGFKNKPKYYEVPYVLEYKISINGKIQNLSVTPYNIFDGIQLRMLDGKMPISDDQIVITKQLATQLLKYTSFNDIKNLIGKEIDISINDLLIDGASITDKPKEMHLTICGITYDESKVEDRIYFREGALDNYLSDIYNYDKDKATYTLVSFLADPSYDIDIISEQIDFVLKSNESSFKRVSLGQENTIHYQSADSIRLFMIFTLIAITMMYLVIQVMIFKRERKEIQILNHYHYHTLTMEIAKVVTMFIVVAITQLTFFNTICDYINTLANHSGIANIVTYSKTNYSIALLIMAGFFLMMEVIIYAFKARKHS